MYTHRKGFPSPLLVLDYLDQELAFTKRQAQVHQPNCYLLKSETSTGTGCFLYCNICSITVNVLCGDRKLLHCNELFIHQTMVEYVTMRFFIFSNEFFVCSFLQAFTNKIAEIGRVLLTSSMLNALPNQVTLRILPSFLPSFLPSLLACLLACLLGLICCTNKNITNLSSKSPNITRFTVVK